MWRAGFDYFPVTQYIGPIADTQGIPDIVVRYKDTDAATFEMCDYFFDVVYRTDEEDIYHPFMRKPGSNEFYASYASWRTHQMSDHLPMWVELHIDFSREYLDEVEADIQAHLDG